MKPFLFRSTSSLPPALLEFSCKHLFLPASALVLLSALLMGGGGDLWLADHLYQLEGNHWGLRDAWLTSGLIHRGGKWLSVGASLVVVAALARAGTDIRWRQLRRP